MEKKCKVEGCLKPHLALGYCKNHYRKFKRWGDPLYEIPRQKDQECSVEDCTQKIVAKGLCTKHYQRMTQHGDVDYVNPKFDHAETCRVQGCDRPFYALDLCHTHHTRLVKGYVVDSPIVAIGKRAQPLTESQRFWRLVTEENGHLRFAGARGRFAVAHDRVIRAAAWVWMNAHQGKMEYAVVRPTCGVEDCVLLEHLENVSRQIIARRLADEITHCPHNHAYDENNTLVLRDGSRICRACSANRMHIRRSVYLAGDMDITVEAVGDLCDWICQGCFKPVDPGARGRRTMARSIDHIIPVTKGGSHTWDNVVLMHFGCNTSKSNRVGVEVQVTN